MEHIFEPPPKYEANCEPPPIINNEFSYSIQNFIINKSLNLLKPLCFYFYKKSLDKSSDVKLVYDEDDDIIIYRDENQHSSNIISISILDHIYLCETENTIYIVSDNINITNLQ